MLTLIARRTVMATALVALLAACASRGPEPLAPDEMYFTTMGYSYKHPSHQAKLEQNWSQLRVGMSAREVFDLIGVPAGDITTGAISASEMFDVDYAGNMLKFRKGKLTEYSRYSGKGGDYQRTVRIKKPA